MAAPPGMTEIKPGMYVPTGSAGEQNYYKNVAPGTVPLTTTPTSSNGVFGAGGNPYKTEPTFNDYAKIAANSPDNNVAPTDTKTQAAGDVNAGYQNTRAGQKAIYGTETQGDVYGYDGQKIENPSVLDWQRYQDALSKKQVDFMASQNAAATQSDQYNFQRNAAGAQAGLAGATNQLTQGREGVQSSGNAQAIGEYTTTLNADLAQKQADLNSIIAQRDENLRLAKIARESGQLGAAKNYEDQVNYAQRQIQDLNNRTLETKGKQTELALAVQKQAFDQGMSTLGTLLENGVTITPTMAVKIAQGMGVPVEDVINYNDAVDRIQKDKTLTQEAKGVALEDARLGLERKKTGRDSEKVRELDFLTDAYARGASQDEISWIKEKFGITDYEDPLTSAKLSIARSEAKVAAVKALYEGKEPPYGTKDYWDMKAAEAEARAKMAEFGESYGGEGGTWTPGTKGMRTDRNNNPVAMTTDVAKTLGLVEGVDYERGDKFPGNSNLYTAKLIGDGLQTTIKAFDTAANDPSKKIFYTQRGQPRWTYITMSDQEWLDKTPTEKAQVIKGMYKNEGGNGTFNLESGPKKTTFTPTQLNDGAINSGIPIAEFSKLSEDRKNAYINGYAEFKKVLQGIMDGTGTKTPQEVISGLQNSALPEDVKSNLISQVEAISSPEAKAGIELTKKLQSFFGV